MTNCTTCCAGAHSYDIYITIQKISGVQPAGYQKHVSPPVAEITAIHKGSNVVHTSHKGHAGSETTFLDRETFAITDFDLSKCSEDMVEFFVYDADNYHSTFHLHKHLSGYGMLTAESVREMLGAAANCEPSTVTQAVCPGQEAHEWAGERDINLYLPQHEGWRPDKTDKPRGVITCLVRVVDRGEVCTYVPCVRTTCCTTCNA